MLKTSRMGCNAELLVSEISRRFLIHIITATYPFDRHARHRTILRKKGGNVKSEERKRIKVIEKIAAVSLR